ncbi:hypothetical protein FDK38_002454 [Candidozyma auris]|nr:hypothetical protein FDK38_002454 [[Candida] auris]
MSLDGKENADSTPSKMKEEALSENSPSPSRRALRPISPNKQNNQGVGKLSFLQSDNIDDHFEYIHDFNEDVKQTLVNIETNTKQTNLDLGQLIDRSKNNNQYLNRVLESIAQYSDEVTTEGTATKYDVSTILERLEQVNSNEELFKINSALETISRSIGSSTLSSLITSMRDESMISSQKLEEKINKLAMTLELQEPTTQPPPTDVLLKEVRLIRDIISEQSRKIENRETKHILADKYADLEYKTQQLQERYDLLCQSYERKYEQYSNLASHYRSLCQNVEQLTDDPRMNESKRYGKLQQLHSKRLDAIHHVSDNDLTGLSNRRVVSVPLKDAELK